MYSIHSGEHYMYVWRCVLTSYLLCTIAFAHIGSDGTYKLATYCKGFVLDFLHFYLVSYKEGSAIIKRERNSVKN